jgi:hypothetical protein
MAAAIPNSEPQLSSAVDTLLAAQWGILQLSNLELLEWQRQIARSA